MKGLEPSTFCMASRRSSQLSYIRATPIIGAAGHVLPGVAPRSERSGTPRRVPHQFARPPEKSKHMPVEKVSRSLAR
jgi:hypothetical protein